MPQSMVIGCVADTVFGSSLTAVPFSADVVNVIVPWDAADIAMNPKAESSKNFFSIMLVINYMNIRYLLTRNVSVRVFVCAKLMKIG